MNDKLHSYRVYEDGAGLKGITDEIDLPGFEFLTETLTGFGIAGELEDPTLGLTKPIEWEPKFKTLYGELNLSPLKETTYTIRGSQQGRDPNGNVIFSPIKAIVRGKLKSFTAGKLKAGAPIEPSKKMEVTYYLLQVDGKVLFEIDKYAYKCVINGIDVLAGAARYL